MLFFQFVLDVMAHAICQTDEPYDSRDADQQAGQNKARLCFSANQETLI